MIEDNRNAARKAFKWIATKTPVPSQGFFAKVMWLTGKSLVAVGELDLSHLK